MGDSSQVQTHQPPEVGEKGHLRQAQMQKVQHNCKSCHAANTSNPLFNCPHPLKTYFIQCQHLKPPF